jgi:hypothetical protein
MQLLADPIIVSRSPLPSQLHHEQQWWEDKYSEQHDHHRAANQWPRRMQFWESLSDGDLDDAGDKKCAINDHLGPVQVLAERGKKLAPQALLGLRLIWKGPMHS